MFLRPNMHAASGIAAVEHRSHARPRGDQVGGVVCRTAGQR